MTRPLQQRLTLHFSTAFAVVPALQCPPIRCSQMSQPTISPSGMQATHRPRQQNCSKTTLHLITASSLLPASLKPIHPQPDSTVTGAWQCAGRTTRHGELAAASRSMLFGAGSSSPVTLAQARDYSVGLTTGELSWCRQDVLSLQSGCHLALRSFPWRASQERGFPALVK